MSNQKYYSIDKCSVGDRFLLSSSGANDVTGNSITSTIVSCAVIAISVIVSPQDETVIAGGTVQYSASIINAQDQAVTWSCSSGSINSSGLFTAPYFSESITITAESIAYPGIKGIATVSVLLPEVEGFNPIIEPTIPSESTATYEPNIIYESGSFVMYYTGGWKTPSIFRATSVDAVSWVKENQQIIGLGYGGESSIACRPTVIKYDSMYYCFYADAANDGANWKRATSSDGITWGNVTTVAVSSLIPGRSGFANSAVWVENNVWYALCETFGLYPTWQVYLLKSDDGVTWFVLNDGSPITSLQVADGGMYGGCNLYGGGAINGVYHLFYHACPTTGISPTNAYHATSTDKINWTRTTNPVLTFDGDGMGFDHIADPSVFQSGESLYLFYDQTDDNAQSAYIGVAKISGSISDYINGDTFVRVEWKPERRPGSNPVEYWNLNETSGNRIGSVSGKDLAPSGSVSTTTSPDGGTAVRVSSDGVLSRDSEHDLQVGNFDWTICGWFRVSGETNSKVAITKYSTGNRQYYIYAGEPNGLRFVVYKSDTEYVDVYGTPGTYFPNNTWVFFRAWHSCSTDEIGLQINNGLEYRSSWNKGVNPVGISPIRLGSDGTSNISNRDLSRVSFWKRLITEEECTALYNSGYGVDFPFTP